MTCPNHRPLLEGNIASKDAIPVCPAGELMSAEFAESDASLPPQHHATLSPSVPLYFEPSELYQGLTRSVVMLGTKYIGIVAERRDGMQEFVPYRSGASCNAIAACIGIIAQL